MSALRNLGVCYLAAASVFGIAAAVNDHPDAVFAVQDRLADATSSVFGFDRNLHENLRLAEARGAAFLGRLAPPPAPALAELDIAAPEPWDGREHAHVKMPPIAPPIFQLAHPAPPDARMAAVAPILSEAQITPLPPKAAAPKVTAPPAPPPGIAPGNADAAARLRASLTPEMLANFSLFLYVSKADHGPVAQHMYVFDKTPGGELSLLHDWLVSTGREKIELSAIGDKTFTETPRGYYELDPHRMYEHYTSHAWKQPMPYAMFFNWENQGRQTGLAIHAASGGDISLLGSRASAGCIHLSPRNAKTLFNLIRARYRGPAPQFAFDRASHSTSNMGALAHDAKGHVKMADGYKVLVYIENYGGENVVAALF